MLQGGAGVGEVPAPLVRNCSCFQAKNCFSGQQWCSQRSETSLLQQVCYNRTPHHPPPTHTQIHTHTNNPIRNKPSSTIIFSNLISYIFFNFLFVERWWAPFMSPGANALISLPLASLKAKHSFKQIIHKIEMPEIQAYL